MRLPSALQFISFLCLITTALAVSLSKPGCPEKWGNITIPYPFGIGSECSANSSFTVTCQNSTSPFLSSIKMAVVNISLYGTVVVSQPVSPMTCSDEPITTSPPMLLKGSPFTISGHYNALVVLGCRNSVWLRANKTTGGGCMAICDANSTDTSCNGVNCCQTTIPARIQELQYTYQSINQATNSSFCGYVFPADKQWLQKENYRRHKGFLSDLSNPFDREFGLAPVVLEWEFGDVTFHDRLLGQFCRSVSEFTNSRYYKRTPHYNPLYNYYSYMENEYRSSVRYCTCAAGFQGNPYLPAGCIDEDECITRGCDGTCINTIGGYSCRSGNKSRLKIAFISVGSVLGGLILLLAAWKSAKAIGTRIKANQRHKFFEQNGGLLLEQQLCSTVELEGLQIMKEGSYFLHNQEDSRECHSVEDTESYD